MIKLSLYLLKATEVTGTQSLIVQGGALAVVLFAFIFLLQWLLRNLTKSQYRLERSIHALSLTNMINARSQVLAGIITSIPKDQRANKVEQLFNELKTEINSVESILTELNSKLDVK